MKTKGDKMTWRTVANALDKMPENTYRLCFRLLPSTLNKNSDYATFIKKDSKRTKSLVGKTSATITFLGSERRWFIDGNLIPFSRLGRKTNFLYYEQIAGQEDALISGKPAMYFVVAQRFDETKLHYLSIDIVLEKEAGLDKKTKVTHLADFPIPPNGVLNCFWDDENYNRISQPPFG